MTAARTLLALAFVQLACQCAGLPEDEGGILAASAGPSSPGASALAQDAEIAFLHGQVECARSEEGERRPITSCIDRADGVTMLVEGGSWTASLRGCSADAVSCPLHIRVALPVGSVEQAWAAVERAARVLNAFRAVHSGAASGRAEGAGTDADADADADANAESPAAVATSSHGATPTDTSVPLSDVLAALEADGERATPAAPQRRDFTSAVFIRTPRHIDGAGALYPHVRFSMATAALGSPEHVALAGLPLSRALLQHAASRADEFTQQVLAAEHMMPAQRAAVRAGLLLAYQRCLAESVLSVVAGRYTERWSRLPSALWSPWMENVLLNVFPDVPISSVLRSAGADDAVDGFLRSGQWLALLESRDGMRALPETRTPKLGVVQHVKRFIKWLDTTPQPDGVLELVPEKDETVVALPRCEALAAKLRSAPAGETATALHAFFHPFVGREGQAQVADSAVLPMRTTATKLGGEQLAAAFAVVPSPADTRAFSPSALMPEGKFSAAVATLARIQAAAAQAE